MAVNKIDPKVIFASEAPAQDTPAVFTNRTVGWGETRKNGGRPTIKQMNAEQQSTDLKILWLNENSVTPYDPTIDYPLDAVTIKDGIFKIFDGSVWDVFLDKTDIGLGDVDNTSDLNKPVSVAVETALDLKAEKDFVDNALLLQQQINKRFVTAKDYFAVGDGILRPVSDLYNAGSLAYNPIFKNFADVQQKLPSATLLTDPLDWCALQTAINRQGVDYKTSLLLTGGNYNIGTKTLEVKQSIGMVGVLNLSLGIARITYSGTGAAVRFKKDNYDSGNTATWLYAPIFENINIVGLGGNADTALELWGVSEGRFGKLSLGGTTASRFKTGVKMHKCSILNFEHTVASYIGVMFDFAEDGFSRWNTTAAINIVGGDFYDIDTMFKCNSMSGFNANHNWIESCDTIFDFNDSNSELITAENIRFTSNNCVMNTADSKKIIKVTNAEGKQSRVLSVIFSNNILRYTNNDSNTQTAYEFDILGTEAFNVFDFKFVDNDYFGKSDAVSNSNSLKARLDFKDNRNYNASTLDRNILDAKTTSVFTGLIETTVSNAKVFGRTNKNRSGATVVIDDQNGTTSNMYLYAKASQVAPILAGFSNTGTSLFSINADGSGFFSFVKLAVNSIRNLNGTPASGSHNIGDRVLNSEPAITKPVTEWVCISTSPLTWQQSAHIVYKGTTAQRPFLALRDQGVQYFDTTLSANGKPIWWNGALWIDSLGATV